MLERLEQLPLVCVAHHTAAGREQRSAPRALERVSAWLRGALERHGEPQRDAGRARAGRRYESLSMPRRDMLV